MMLKIKVNEIEKEYLEGASFLQIARTTLDENDDDPLMGIFNGKLVELNKVPKEDGELKILTYKDPVGYRAYRRSTVFLLQRALKEFFKGEEYAPDVSVMYSLGPGYFCKIEDERELKKEDLLEIKGIMERFVSSNIPINKFQMKTEDARKMFFEQGMYDKERLLKYRSASNINIYELDGLKDYFYGYMVPQTGCLKYFDLHKYDNGFLLQFPEKKDPTVLKEFSPANKLFNVLKLSNEWSKTLEIGTVGALNDKIAEGKAGEIIRTQEALMEARIAELARDIANDPERKFVMIAGPSSSGKTTFSHRLSTQLSALGLHPHPLSLDNYYLDRELMPLDEFGEKDFESIEGLNIKQFNEDMERLLAGETVEIPTFNFVLGKSEYRGNTLSVMDDDILVIEGIHGLNDRMSESLPKESKYKIYISALTQLSIDEHNPLSTTDNRLIRRLVRDARTRGTCAKDTIAMWPSVRRGEEKNIFPFQENADAIFNSALIYEMSVLKLYAVPMLYAIESSLPEYKEAKRILKFLDYFLPIPPELIGQNSLVREFIGGSCFKV